DAIGACDQFRNPPRCLNRRKYMGEEGVGVDHASLDRAHHPLEVRGQGIAACEQRRFPLVKLGIPERDLLFDHAQEDIGATMRYVVETTLYRVDVSRGIEYAVKHLPVRPCRELGLYGLPGSDNRLEPKLAASVFEPLPAHVKNRDLR